MFPQIYKILSNFDSNALICGPTLFPGKNSPNIAKCNRAFPGEGREDRTLILTYLDSPMARFFPTTAYLFRLRPSSRETVGQSWTKVPILGPSLFHENINLSIFFQTMLLFDTVLPLVRISAISDHVWGSKGPKTSEKSYFMDAELVRKTLKTFNLTTTNPIIRKLITIMYLQNSVNRKPLKAKNSVFWCNVYECLDFMKNHHIHHALVPWKTSQYRSKTIAPLTF